MNHCKRYTFCKYCLQGSLTTAEVEPERVAVSNDSIPVFTSPGFCTRLVGNEVGDEEGVEEGWLVGCVG